MNHLPFDWSDNVDDGHFEADFIGGVWDGKTYTLPSCMPEWKVAILPMPKWKFINKPPGELVKYDIAVYRHVGHGIYWLSRIEKGDEQ
jgi:hypothetical protein